MAFPVTMNWRLPNQMWEPRAKLALSSAAEDMLVGRGWDNVAMLDPAGLVSCDAQSSPYLARQLSA
jgi:hypothetical protein